MVSSHFHLLPNKQAEGTGLGTQISPVTEDTMMIYDFYTWELQMLVHIKRVKNLLSTEKERKNLVAQCSSQTLKRCSVGCHEYASHWLLQTKRVILSRLFPHVAGEKGLICNHQRNADRLETGLHSIILIRIKDLFWRSFLGFLLPAPPTPNEAICIHETSEADMKSDSLQTYISDSVAWVLNLNVAWFSVCGKLGPQVKTNPKHHFIP